MKNNLSMQYEEIYSIQHMPVSSVVTKYIVLYNGHSINISVIMNIQVQIWNIVVAKVQNGSVC